MVAQSHGSNLRKRALRILCADDDPLFREVMDRVFSSAGHSVECVGNGTTAWKRMSPDLNRFDVLVTDHRMPGIDGLALVGLLRQADYRGQIIVHSSTLTAQEAASYRALGVRSIVVKSTHAEELLNILEAFIAS